MDHASTIASEQSSNKRPRSLSGDSSLPTAKVPRTHEKLSINYLHRQHKETIPLVTVNEKLPEILRLVGEYDGVIQRHESMAGNLGACPLGPILLKRFERLFDGPPRILKSHGKESNVTWLDVVEFAQNKPEQFNLEKMRNGIRVCQFYTKQCRVEISEEDFVLVASGMPQKLIPPQPILEDEDKELAVMDLLDRNLGQVVQLADQVSARARQLVHKMKNRRSAILSRREVEVDSRRGTLRSNGSPMSPAETNGLSNRPVRSIEASQSPPMGFTAVNMRQSITSDSDGRSALLKEMGGGRTEEGLTSASGIGVSILNGTPFADASPDRRVEHMTKFLTPSEREAGLTADTVRRTSFGTVRTNSLYGTTSESKPRSGSIEQAGSNTHKTSPSVAIPNTPASLLPHAKPSHLERDDGGPFKTEMVGRMESMQRGERVIPPCDRCRRLHMDCLKNLTACMGCTKKHAKCSWKDVRVEELQQTASPPAREHGPEEPAGQGHELPAAGSVVQRPNAAEEPGQSRPERGQKVDEQERVARDRHEEAISIRASKSLSPTPSSAAFMSPGAPFSSARFDVRPPPLGQQGHDAANRRGSSQHPPFLYHSHAEGQKSTDRNDQDEGDRLQALAAQVYRSASQSARPQD